MMNRLCSSTVNTYTYKEKVTDLNEALDWYLQLAFMSDKRWNFDDIAQTSPPIDTQDIVSGTNRYKVDSFTNKIIDLLKLEILDSNGNGITLLPETLDSFGNIVGNESGRISSINGDSFRHTYIDAPSGTPTHYIKYGDFIYLRPKPNYNYTAGLLAYFHRPLAKFSFVECTVTNATDTINSTAHGLAAGDEVIFETTDSGTLPGGVTKDTTYYVISSGLTADAFKVSATSGGSTISISSDGSGVIYLKTSGSPGIVSIHHQMLARKAALTYLSYQNSPKLGFLPTQVQIDEKAIMAYFANRGADIEPVMRPMVEDNR